MSEYFEAEDYKLKTEETNLNRVTPASQTSRNLRRTRLNNTKQRSPIRDAFTPPRRSPVHASNTPTHSPRRTHNNHDSEKPWDEDVDVKAGRNVVKDKKFRSTSVTREFGTRDPDINGSDGNIPNHDISDGNIPNPDISGRSINLRNENHIERTSGAELSSLNSYEVENQSQSASEKDVLCIEDVGFIDDHLPDESLSMTSSELSVPILTESISGSILKAALKKTNRRESDASLQKRNLVEPISLGEDMEPTKNPAWMRINEEPAEIPVINRKTCNEMEKIAAVFDTNSFSQPYSVGERTIDVPSTTMLGGKGLSEDNSSYGQQQTNQHKITSDFGKKNKSADEGNENFLNEIESDNGSGTSSTNFESSKLNSKSMGQHNSITEDIKEVPFDMLSTNSHIVSHDNDMYTSKKLENRSNSPASQNFHDSSNPDFLINIESTNNIENNSFENTSESGNHFESKSSHFKEQLITARSLPSDSAEISSPLDRQVEGRNCVVEKDTPQLFEELSKKSDKNIFGDGSLAVEHSSAMFSDKGLESSKFLSGGMADCLQESSMPIDSFGGDEKLSFTTTPARDAESVTEEDFDPGIEVPPLPDYNAMISDIGETEENDWLGVLKNAQRSMSNVKSPALTFTQTTGFNELDESYIDHYDSSKSGSHDYLSKDPEQDDVAGGKESTTSLNIVAAESMDNSSRGDCQLIKNATEFSSDSPYESDDTSSEESSQSDDDTDKPPTMVCIDSSVCDNQGDLSIHSSFSESQSEHTDSESGESSSEGEAPSPLSALHVMNDNHNLTADTLKFTPSDKQLKHESRVVGEREYIEKKAFSGSNMSGERVSSSESSSQHGSIPKPIAVPLQVDVNSKNNILASDESTHSMHDDIKSSDLSFDGDNFMISTRAQPQKLLVADTVIEDKAGIMSKSEVWNPFSEKDLSLNELNKGFTRLLNIQGTLDTQIAAQDDILPSSHENNVVDSTNTIDFEEKEMTIRKVKNYEGNLPEAPLDEMKEATNITKTSRSPSPPEQPEHKEGSSESSSISNIHDGEENASPTISNFELITPLSFQRRTNHFNPSDYKIRFEIGGVNDARGNEQPFTIEPELDGDVADYLEELPFDKLLMHPDDLEITTFPSNVVNARNAALIRSPSESSRNSVSYHTPLTVNSSGEMFTRTSLTSILLKKWQKSLWVQCGRTKFLVFRSKDEFIEWNDRIDISEKKRDQLVRFKVDFEKEMCKSNVRGFKLTNIKPKIYSKGGPLMHQFKLERWMDLGPSIAAAFASQNPKEVHRLHSVLHGCLQLCPGRGLKSIKDLLIDNKKKKSPFS